MTAPKLTDYDTGEGIGQFLNLGSHVGDGHLDRWRLLGVRACHSEK
jgi:hypothetical protein